MSSPSPHHPQDGSRPAGWNFLRTGLLLAFRTVYRGFNAAAVWRRNHPKKFHFFYIGTLTIIASFFLSHEITPLVVKGLERLGLHFTESSKELYLGVVHLAVGTLLGTIGSFLLALLAPFVLIAQRAIAVDTMGLEWASIDGDMQAQLKWYLRFQAPTERVRIICISGRSLFRETPDGAEPPLMAWAKSGHIDLVVPRAIATNATVKERYGKYCTDFLQKNYPNGIDDLVDEMKKGIAHLKHFNGNTVTEHNVLVLWRVVLLSKFCIVQSYFPNAAGYESDRAPLFVYMKNGSSSFYETYSEMFDMLRRNPLSAA